MLHEYKLKEFSSKAKDWIVEGIVEHQHLLELFEITPGPRRQMFLAQLAHESDGFKTTREYASGEAYEGRSDLGNTEDGDGTRFRGRGLIQLTGRYNYTAFNDYANNTLQWEVDYLSEPNELEHFPAALQTAVWYWTTRKLNVLADEGNFERITRKINGGLNGYKDRLRYLSIAENLDL